jgi:DUF1680 family protein
MHVSTSRSKHTHWHTLPLGSIRLSEGFWAHKQAVNRQVSLRHGYRKLEQSGNFNNLRLAAGSGEGEYRRPLFMDSDVHKWLEAVAYDLANAPDPELERMAQQTVGLLAEAQRPDGYLNSYYQVVEPENRWKDLDHGHELYCAGHMFEAAVAMHRATGETRLLEVARRFADHIGTVFGPGKREGTSGHPEIELALVELYRETGERCYLDLAAFFVDQRGRGKMRGLGRYGPEYHQDRVPVRDSSVVEGHAVRQLYLTAGVTDLFLETGEAALFDAMLRQWHDMTAHKMHVTAGYGARHHGESFGVPYELPSDSCYCETCAAIAGMMWNWRMLLATGEARYADLLERSLYNGFLSGVSLDGQRYFYVNPLLSRGGIERPEWYGCACCPPNVMRQIAVVGHYVATVDDTGIQLHQYAPATIEATLPAGRSLVLRTETAYPWQGQVRVMIEQSDGSPWRLALRVPGWCHRARLSADAEVLEDLKAGGYATVERAWQPGDEIVLDLPLEPRLTEAHPRTDAIRDSLCIERGPIVYCLEEIDQEPGLDLMEAGISPDAAMRAVWREDLLGAVMVVEAEGAAFDLEGWGDQLYRPATKTRARSQPARLTGIPYYAWANRGPGKMRVWMPRIES